MTHRVTPPRNRTSGSALSWLALVLLAPSGGPARAQDAGLAPASPDAEAPLAPSPEPELATSDTEPALATSDTDPALATSDTDPALATSDADPALATSDADSALATSDTEPALATSDTEPSPEPAPPHDWIDDLEIMGFVDLYVAAHWGLPRPFEGNQGSALALQRAYDVDGGATLSFVGLDVAYAPRPIGATLRLRAGSSTPRLVLNTTGLPDVLEFLYEAYVSWRPSAEIRFDFGEFVTPYGAEVAESWRNPNYTRGSLYQIAQPFYHVGLRAVIDPAPWVTVTLIAVNGWNNFVDTNDGKSGGIQASFHAGALNVAVGYLLGPEGAMDPSDADDENGQLRHFVDAVVTLDLADLDLVANADLVADDVGAQSLDYLWGAMLGARYQVIPELALALRGEYVEDPDLAQGDGRDLVTVTGTFDVRPFEHLVLRLDLRADVGTSPRFVDTLGVGHDWVFSTVLGVVVHSDG